jgi:hypothetical protein
MIVTKDDRIEVDSLIAQALAGDDSMMIVAASLVAKQALDPMIRAIFAADGGSGGDVPIEKAMYAIKRMITISSRLTDHYGEVATPLLLKGLLVSFTAAGVGGDDEDREELFKMLDQQISEALAEVGEDGILGAFKEASASEAN